MAGRTFACGIACGALVLSAAGCSTAPGHRGVATGEVTRTVNLFYATDRAVESREQGRVEYGWRRAYFEEGEACELGVCQVEIKRQRNHDKTGPLPKSHTELVSVMSTTPLEHEAFYERLREMMWYANANETFVFIHGFNNTFEDAAKRTAEIWYDVGFDGPPVMYSWPSRGGSFWRGVFGYFADSETIKWSVVHLKRFLIDLVGETASDKLFAEEPARIHLVAHSMGGRLMARALMAVADELRGGERPIFCDVILAAPDIDRDLFRDVVVLELLRSRLAEHYTLYASSTDVVIKTSQKLQVYPRAGNADDGLVAVHHSDFDTVDASAVESGWLTLNHDYFITEPRVIRDLIEVLRKGNRDPGAHGRTMFRRDDEPGAPWVMLPDAEPDEELAIGD
ncbi:MAG: alpha/beta hydrolase [Planctomycetota bacterium]|jgi:esterase/lipase superfamily enzyme